MAAPSRLTVRAAAAAASPTGRCTAKSPNSISKLLPFWKDRAATVPLINETTETSETAERLVATLVRQYRTHPRLLRALSLFLDGHVDSDFGREARRLMADNLQLISTVLLNHRKSIRHPNPQRAVLFAVLSVASNIETIVFEGDSLWHVALPLDDAKLSAELARSLIAYLRYSS